MIVHDDIPEIVADVVDALNQCDDVAMLDTVIIAYRYSTPDGDEMWNYHVRGDSRITPTMGLLEVVKLRMMTPSLHEGLTEYAADLDDEP